MNLIETAIDILYPRRCPVCHNVIAPNQNLICDSCRRKLGFVKEPVCKKCGKPISDGEAEYCFDCSRHKLYFNEGRAVFIYDSNMKQSIYQFKYNNKREYGKFYASEIIKSLQTDISRWKPDALVPIPIHKSKMKTRGFNQAYVLAKELGNYLQIPVRNDILIRNKKTSAQKQLTLDERQINLKNAFKIVQNDVKLNTIILIDDIYTTGSTINEAAKICKEAGIINIYFICIAIGRGI